MSTAASQAARAASSATRAGAAGAASLVCPPAEGVRTAVLPRVEAILGTRPSPNSGTPLVAQVARWAGAMTGGAWRSIAERSVLWQEGRKCPSTRRVRENMARGWLERGVAGY